MNNPSSNTTCQQPQKCSPKTTNNIHALYVIAVKLKGNFKPYEVLPKDERWERSSRYVFPARDSKHGKWTEWYENGQKKLEQHYKCGRYIGTWIYWYENGQKKSVSNYIDGGLPGMRSSIVDGQFTVWHENGQKRSEGYYKKIDQKIS